LPPESVDLIVTSPPYDVDIQYDGYSDNLPYPKYLEFIGKALEKCYELAKPDGRLCLNIPLDKNKGGQRSVYADIVTIAKGIGWQYHTTIVWNEQNISRRTAWGSWLSASAPFVIAPVEMIVVMYKHQWQKQRKGVSDITREEFLEWTNGVWTFSGESRKKVGHPYRIEVNFIPKRGDFERQRIPQSLWKVLLAINSVALTTQAILQKLCHIHFPLVSLFTHPSLPCRFSHCYSPLSSQT
jgi:site-specific DNA-methyltransferase (adenine-specific)